MHQSRRADDQHDVGTPRGGERFLERGARQRFPEPDDVRPPPAAARVRERVERHLVDRTPRVARGAARLAQRAVQLEHAPRAGAMVQRVDVLRDQREVGRARLEGRQRAVRRRRLDVRVGTASLEIPRPDQHRIAREAVR